jgi:hypothetical protein
MDCPDRDCLNDANFVSHEHELYKSSDKDKQLRACMFKLQSLSFFFFENNAARNSTFLNFQLFGSCTTCSNS